MTDVRETDAPAARNDNGPNPAGDFIWYELMTTDPDGAKAFYDAVVGWNIGEGVGGIWRLSDDQHGRRRFRRRAAAPDRRDAAERRAADLARLYLRRRMSTRR